MIIDAEEVSDKVMLSRAEQQAAELKTEILQKRPMGSRLYAG
ncbi:hypothetical protein [Hymenobacter busanensis]|nr:hypothetical protein [Hymenobacter busanensis]